MGQYPLARVAAFFARVIARVLARVPDAFITRGLQMALDGALCGLSLFTAYQLRFDGNIPPAHLAVMWSLILLVPVVRPLSMLAFGAYDSIWRYFNLRDAAVLALCAAPLSGLLLAMRYLLARKIWDTVVPASVIVVELVLYFGFASLLRVVRRVSYEISRPAEAHACRALLVGTEPTLPAALRHLSGEHGIFIVGLLAPEAELLGLRIGGFLVMEKPEALSRLLVTQRIDVVFIADTRPEWIGETVATASDFGAEVRLLPSAANVLRGDVQISAKATAELALGRSSIDSEASPALAAPHPRVLENFRDRVVLVTGAGGSIGSELARQLTALPVSSIVLLDQDENSIFELTNSLAAMAIEAGRSTRIVPVVGDIRDASHLRVIFEQYRPHIILHAAAYKHVPVMESNACEAVLNNVCGTREIAQVAIQFGAERFIMISTDKAVRPSSVMGATKRIAEMLVSERSRASAGDSLSSRTRLACVRFGNVVGSRGSVVPIFLRQIAAGGPITITDQHMTRYFMTIPEAAQLVLQASSLASDGEVYMLDMGDPVKITVLARKLIELSGLRPDKDIAIQFVGTRPGEKIAEQLWHQDATIKPTDFPRVFTVNAGPTPAGFADSLNALEEAALRRNEAAVMAALRRMPIGFTEQPASASIQKQKSKSAFVN